MTDDPGLDAARLVAGGAITGDRQRRTARSRGWAVSLLAEWIVLLCLVGAIAGWIIAAP